MKASAAKAGLSAADYTVQALKSGAIRFACEQPDSGHNHPRNLFVWRSNLLGSSGKGHEYMLKYLLGTDSGIQGEALGSSEGIKPEEVEWQSAAIEGKLDLLVTLDFRMSSTCLFSDIVLPTATWYEKDDMNTSDMHPFIHPFPPRSILPGNPKATGKSTKVSPASFLKCVSDISDRKPMWCYTRSSMIPRRNWRSHLIFSTGVKASANLFRAKPPQYRRG